MTTTNTFLQELEKNKDWPLRYMFKFIAPNKEATILKIKKELPKSERTTAKFSKNGKYIAITCVAMMESAQKIVDITMKIHQIEGVLAL